MKQVLTSATLAVTLLVQTVPAQAQSDDLQDGLGLFLDGLQDEMGDVLKNLQDLSDLAEPALREFLLRMGPALADMMEEVQDWARYAPPEMLPNGDIIIRRKPEPELDAPEPELPRPPELPDDDGGAVDI